MGILAKIFTWWNGATVGTGLFTRFRGEQVGRDDAGNTYFRHKDDPRRRWVIYDGANDGSRVPPDWQAWLRGPISDLPGESLPPVRRFQQKPTGNLTGTMQAFRPDGSLGSGKIRPASTGDYEPWIPGEQ
jgi:NADH:ubiquinone oxidoreductase subunit